MQQQKTTKRQRLFVSRFSKSKIENVIDWCDNNGAAPILSPEVTNDDSKMQSFYSVFVDSDSTNINDTEFWPINVTLAKYFLNQETRDWLKEQLERPSAKNSRPKLFHPKLNFFNCRCVYQKTKKISTLIYLHLYSSNY